MAKAKFNSILKGLQGKIGSIVFYRRKDTYYSRIYVKGRNPDTEAQRIIRRTFGDAVKSWQGMTMEEKSKFNRKARNLNMSGYNLHISEYMKTRVPAVQKPDFKKKTPDKMYSPPVQRRAASVSPPFTSKFLDRMPHIHSQCGHG